MSKVKEKEQMWVCPKAGECVLSCYHKTPHKFSFCKSIGNECIEDYGCSPCIPYVEPKKEEFPICEFCSKIAGEEVRHNPILKCTIGIAEEEVRIIERTN